MTIEDARPGQSPITAESNGADRQVYAVGVGPGDPSYVHERTRSILERADVVVGFETVIEVIDSMTDAALLACSYDTEAERLDEFADRVDAGAVGTAVLMGDPNVSGDTFVGKVERAVTLPVEVVPGISSIQIAASNARTPIESSTFVTLHTRGGLEEELTRLVRAAGDRHLLIIPRPYDYMPERIASVLVDRGVEPSLEAIVFERLTFEGEAATRTTLHELSNEHRDGDSEYSDLSVMVVRADP